MTAKKYSIKFRVLAFALIIPATLAILFALITFLGVNRIGSNALDTNEKTGHDISRRSEEVLTSRVMQQAQELALSQASISNATFSTIESNVYLLLHYAALIEDNPTSFRVNYSYSRDTVPKKPTQATVYKLPPYVVADAEFQQQIDRTSALDDIMIPLCKSDPNIQSLFIGYENGFFRSTPWLSRDTLPDSFEPRTRGWYQQGILSEKLNWSDLYIDASSGKLVISCFVPLKNKSGEKLGVVCADVALTAINERIINTQLGNSGHAFLLDNKGRLIAGEGISAEGKHWYEKYDTKSFNSSKNRELTAVINKMIAQQSGVSICPSDKYGMVVIAYAPLKNLSWSLGIIKPIKEIIDPALKLKTKIQNATQDSRQKLQVSMLHMLYLLLAVFILTIILAILFAVKFGNKIIYPLLQLNTEVRQIGKGNFDRKVIINTGDEIEELAANFNQMTTDLKDHIVNLQQITAEKEKISSELTIAKDIQHSILPKIFPPFPKYLGLDIFASLESAKEVGGDLYDFVLLDEEHLYICIGDVSGKGVPASLFMAVGKTLLKSMIQTVKDPALTLNHVNNELASGNDACMFITLFCGIFNLRTRELTYANAGHNPPLIITEDTVEFIEFAKNPPLAALEDIEFINSSITLEKGSKFLLYTDGVTEAMNSADELYSEERLLKLLQASPSKTAEKCIHTINKDLKKFTGIAEQSDDITMICFSYTPQENTCNATKEYPVTIHLTNHLQELTRLISWLEGLGEKMNWSTSTIKQLNLILEEWLVNIISYAFPETDNLHEIEIQLWQEHNTVYITISDDGIKFDPTRQTEPDISAPLEEREIGGLGIHFIMNNTSSQNYQRTKGKNYLTMSLNL